jgi:hypothetical protein
MDMKFWHQKFSESELEVKDEPNLFKTDNKNKKTYLLNQFLIWISIFFVLILIVNFLKNNIHLTNI